MNKRGELSLSVHERPVLPGGSALLVWIPRPVYARLSERLRLLVGPSLLERRARLLQIRRALLGLLSLLVLPVLLLLLALASRRPERVVGLSLENAYPVLRHSGQAERNGDPPPLLEEGEGDEEDDEEADHDERVAEDS